MADEPAAINLKVLSPSTELEGGVTFAQLPTATTVGQLRRRIQDAVPSKPAPDRMRLIYRGRVVADDSLSLEAVFGAANIRDNKDQSLHLVLPPSLPSSASPAPRSSTAPPNPFRAAQSPPPTASPPQTNPFRAVPPAEPTASLPQTAQPHHHHHHHHPHLHPHVNHHHHHPPGPVNPVGIVVPAPLPQHIAQALAQAGQPHAQHPPTQGPQPFNPTLPMPAIAAHGHSPTSGVGAPPASGLSNAASNSGRTVRQEGVGPNGARWSVTINETNAPMQGQNVAPSLFNLNQNPPGFALPSRQVATPDAGDAATRLLPRLRTMLGNARQEIANARVLGTPAMASRLASIRPPHWRLLRTRLHLQQANGHLATAEWEWNRVINNTHSTQSALASLTELRRSIYELRTEAEEICRSLDQEQYSTSLDPNSSTDSGPQSSSAPEAPATVPSETASTQSPSLAPQAQATASTMPADCPPELFLLSSPQGPIGVVFDQRGTYTTAPIVRTLPFQSFTNQFTQNRQLIAGLGQQLAQGNGFLHNQLAAPTPTRQPTTADPEHQVQDALRNVEAQVLQERPPNPPAADNDRVANLGGHVWLILKLACFVYFFAGGGSGYYRPILLGIIAGIVYLAQTGMFEEQFNVLRRHFEALLPVGALAEHVAAPAAQQPTTFHGGEQNARTRNGVALTPQQAAQRLLQQRREQRFGWAREGLRSVERAFALFLASLWPGIGERMVHAQEERERLERVARREEEERRVEEEKRRREEEEKKQAEAEKNEEMNGESGEVSGEANDRGTAKVKERADEARVPTEGETAT